MPLPVLLPRKLPLPLLLPAHPALLASLAAVARSTSKTAKQQRKEGDFTWLTERVYSIIASCLGTTGAQLNACATNDWDCMCEQTTNVLTCYNNCPSDPRRNGVDQQNVSYCNAAKAYVKPDLIPIDRIWPSGPELRSSASSLSVFWGSSNFNASNAC